MHAGICDNRMWDAVAPALADAELHELRGFGDTPAARGRFSHADDLELRLAGEPRALVGASYGGQVCLELAARRPDLVTDLVLLDAALPDHDWSPAILDYAAAEERLLEAGDVDGAVALNVDFWVGAAAPAVRDLVATMQRRAFELQLGVDNEDVQPEAIDLRAIRARTLVVWGERDHADFALIGARLGREIADAKTAVVAGAGHLPALEQPDTVKALLERFLQH